MQLIKTMGCHKRKNLLMIRSGSYSEHQQWFQADADRSWDLLIIYHTLPKDSYEDHADIVIYGGNSKFSSVFEAAKEFDTIFDDYESLAFFDDDLNLRFSDMDVLFSYANFSELALWQPSLSHDSPYSHEITLNNPAFIVRYTNFVEVMAPIFTKAAFNLCLPTFNESVSGWGLDFLWPKMLEQAGYKLGIIDHIKMKHCRPIGSLEGGFYSHLQSMGIDAPTEMRNIVDKYALTTDPSITGGILKVSSTKLVQFLI